MREEGKGRRRRDDFELRNGTHHATPSDGVPPSYHELIADIEWASGTSLRWRDREQERE